MLWQQGASLPQLMACGTTEGALILFFLASVSRLRKQTPEMPKKATQTSDPEIELVPEAQAAESVGEVTQSPLVLGFMEEFNKLQSHLQSLFSLKIDCSKEIAQLQGYFIEHSTSPDEVEQLLSSSFSSFRDFHFSEEEELSIQRNKLTTWANAFTKPKVLKEATNSVKESFSEGGNFQAKFPKYFNTEVHTALREINLRVIPQLMYAYGNNTAARTKLEEKFQATKRLTGMNALIAFNLTFIPT